MLQRFVKKKKLHLPVNICWKAASTFVVSRADVSIKDRLFFSEKIVKVKEGQ